MCGRFTQKSERKVLQEEFFIQEFTDHVIVSYNVAPSQKAGVVLNDGVNRYAQFTWGLVPPWAKDPKIGSGMINARGETVTSKPSFKRPFQTRRCIVPADGFYEWKKENGHKAPFYIYSRSERPLGLAGLWERWTPKGPDGDVSDKKNPLYTFTIITVEASPALKDIHDRMPVIIPQEKRELWLSESGDTESLLVPYAGEDLRFHEVSRFVNSPKNDSPECIVAVSS